MAINYARSRKTAERLIRNFGGDGSVVKEGIPAGGRNPDGSVNPGTPDVVITGIITPIDSASMFEVNNQNIQAGDGFVFFHSDTAAEIGMVTTINGVKYRIIAIADELTSIAGVRVYLELQLRI